ncbi:MAG TPA: MCE family protein, partial [Desulfarculaceae bacterium]|nr:MCE family protein [Desulfarculaceae bacterium]
METPVIKRRRGISPIWILPFIALLIGGWLLLDNYQNAGIDIIVHFDDAEGITVGKTNVIYKGIVIGTVRNIKVDPGVDSVSLGIEINKVAKHGVVKDTKFWIVKPEVSAGQISGLETLLSGSYIAVQRGISEQPCREFIGLPEPPPISQEAPGLHLKLTSKNLGSIQRNTKLYYKNIPVGSVQGYTLDEAGSGVIIDAYIESRYKHLIKTKTRFWNSSGINFKGGLSGFKFRMESMAALIYGGISLYTPTYQENSPAAESNRIFSLYEDFDDAEFGLKMTLKLPTAQGIEAGITKVVYRGFEAGVVTDINFDDNKHVVTALINIDPRAEFILREGTRFWVVEPEFSINRVRNLDTLIKGVYIAFEPGDGIFKDYFDVQKAPLTDKLMPAGKRFTIISKDSGSIAIAAPVLYRKLKVGEIFDFHLGADGSNIRGQILIYQKYTHLIKNNSVFWKVGGIKVKANLNGIDVETGTFDTMLAGGISFINPDDGSQPEIAAEHHKFTLYDNIEEASRQVPALRKRGIKIQLKAANAKDFSVGSPVLYKFVEVGAVTGFALAEKGKHVLIDLFIAQKYAPLLSKSSLFYNISNISVKGDLSGIEIKTGSVRSMLAGGIAFISPDSDNPDSDRISDGQQYTLYDSKYKALDFGKSMISIKFANSKGLKSGLKIR